MTARIMSVNSDYKEKESEILKFYDGKNVFLTGATGFLGKFTLEKLLRTCTGVDKIYVLARSRKNKSFNLRISEMLQSPLFSNLNYSRVVPIEGDLSSPNVGISEKDQNILRENVNIVFHCAATVRFEEKFKKALQLNVLATYDLLNLCSSMNNLQAFVHVSTAFSHSHKYELEEHIYQDKMTYERIIGILEKDDDEINAKLNFYLGDWINSYTFSKAATERMIADKFSHLPVSIFRPAIVHVSSQNHPVSGYHDNIFDAIAGIQSAVAYGLLRVLQLKESIKAPLVPVDYSINAMLLIGYHTAKNKYDEPKVFNYSASQNNPVFMYDFVKKAFELAMKTPLINSYWYPQLIMTNNKLRLLVLRFLNHYLPALILDGLLKVTGKEPKFVSIFQKVHHLNTSIDKIFATDYNFHIDNIFSAVYDDLSSIDKALFYVDMRTFDWKNYLHATVAGLRVHLLKDTPDTIPAAKRKYQRQAILHYTIVYGILLGAIYLLWICLRKMFIS